MIETKTYLRNPFEVEAVQVTEENMQQVAEWCRGKVRTEPAKDVPKGKERRKFIKVFVYRPASDKQTMAFAGDYILHAGQGFKVYTEGAFKKGFSLKVESAAVDNFTVSIQDDEVKHRSAETGKYVTDEFAEENPDTTVAETD